MIHNRELSNRQAGCADEAPPVSPSRLAEHWGVHVNTVYRDIRKGALRAFRLPGGRFRIRWEDARRYGRPLD
jgi:excisionase family DNA binding protein